MNLIVPIKYISFDMNISYNSKFSKNAPKTSLLSTWAKNFHLRENFKFHCNFVELQHNSDQFIDCFKLCIVNINITLQYFLLVRNKVLRPS